ncbi:MAG: hypothetical protein ACYSU7_03390 [Planctomycetota bacterium]
MQLACVILAGSCPSLFADIVTWDAFNGTWDNPANWNPSIVPGPGDDAIIDVPDFDATITYQSIVSSVNSVLCAEQLLIAGTGVLDVSAASEVAEVVFLDGTLGGAGDLLIGLLQSGPSNVAVLEGSTKNCAAVDLNRATLAGSADVIVLESALLAPGSPGLYLEGTGRLILAETATSSIMIPGGTSGIMYLERTLENRGYLSWEEGQIRFLDGTLHNTATGILVVTTGEDWESQGGVNEVVNDGLLLLRTGNPTTIESGIPLHNGGTVVFVEAFSPAQRRLRINGGGVNNGHFEVGERNTLEFNSDYTHADEATISCAGFIEMKAGTHVFGGQTEIRAKLEVEAAASMTVAGVLGIGGQPTSTDSASQVFLQGQQLLDGTGEIAFLDDDSRNCLCGPIGNTLTVGPGVLVHGDTGTVAGYDSTLLETQGVLRADVPGGTITVETQSWTNSGEAGAEAGGTLAVIGAWTNTGVVAAFDGGIISAETYLQQAGEVRIDGGVFFAGSLDIEQGVVSGDGVIGADAWTNQGTVRPGDAPVASGDEISLGTLLVVGEFTQLAAGAIEIEIDALGHDALEVAGDVSLAGALVVQRGESVPDSSTVYEIIQGIQVAGVFDTTTLPGPCNKRVFALSYTETAVQLVVAPGPAHPDLDCDGVVGVTDFLILLANWGLPEPEAGDLNGDGVVGILDFLLLLASWG